MIRPTMLAGLSALLLLNTPLVRSADVTPLAIGAQRLISTCRGWTARRTV